MSGEQRVAGSTLDAVVAPSADAAESVWLGAGNGTFSAHPTVPTFGGGDSRDVKLGRLNGDAFLDVIVANHAGQPETVWLNNGSGVFTAQPTMPSFGGGDSTSVALGDLDGDGDLDAVVANDITAAETVWMKNGSGVFTAHTVVPSFGAGDSYEVALGDLDGDTDLDAVVANASTQPETVWLNDGTGKFTAHSTPSFGGGSSVGLALADVNADGKLDAVVSNVFEPNTVWLNDGTGTFTAHPTTPSFGTANSTRLALGDIDGDNDPDAIVGGLGATTFEWLRIWVNNGAGSFIPHPVDDLIAANRNVSDVALGDLDGDGDLDFLVASYTGAVTIGTNVDAETVKPACTFTIVNENPKRIDFTITDTGSGVSSIRFPTAVNIVLPVVIPGATAFDNTFYFFTPAKTLPITFSVIKSNQALGARVAVVITDLVGNRASCI